MLQKRRLEPHEVVQLAERVAWDREMAQCDVEELLGEVAHRLAFRQGLGNPLYASEIASEAMEAATVSEWIAGAWSQLSQVIGINADHAQLTNQLGQLPIGKEASHASPLPPRQPTLFHGGQQAHIEAANSGLTELLLAFKAPGRLQTREWQQMNLLHSLLLTSLLPSLADKLRASQPIALRPFLAGYSDASLFGVRVTVPSAASDKLTSILQSLLAHLRSCPLENPEQLEKAKEALLLHRADVMSRRQAACLELAQQLASTGRLEDLSALQAALSPLQSSDLQKVHGSHLIMV